MGQEADCRVRWGRRWSDGQARLEREELLFRGEFRLRIALRDISRLEARDSRLTVEWPDGRAVFELGAPAEKWAARIKNPRGLMDKLGVKPDSRVATLGLGDDGVAAPALLDELRSRARSDVVHVRCGADHCARVNPTAGQRDIVFVGLRSADDLPALAHARVSIHDAGAVWAVWTKGRKELREADVRDFALSHGLVDVKVASVSESLSGLKLVIPVAQRRTTPKTHPRRGRRGGVTT